MTKHTSGTWRWRGQSLKNSDNGWSIVRQLTYTTEADKALIAAAPDMLWLLNQLVDQDWFEDDASMQLLVAEVIAKAEGKD